MSLSKRIKVDDNYRRDSYSDRICDDLSEVILQFLILKDKLRFECVSKQFQRTIFRKQMVFEYNFKIKTDDEWLYFEKYLQKLSNANKLLIESNSCIDAKIYGKAINLFDKHCHSIRHLDMYDVGQYKTEFDQIYQKYRHIKCGLLDRFGPQLLSLRLYDIQYKNWQTVVDNIEELDIFSFPSNLSELKFKRLKSLSFNHIIELCDDMEELLEFLELNADTIEHLSLATHYLWAEEEDLQSILKIISKMTKLIDLNIDSKIEMNDKRMAPLWRDISLNCIDLKRLDIKFEINEENMKSMDELLSPLRGFKELKRLTIHFRLNLTARHIKEFSFKMFEGFQKITHLTIINSYANFWNDHILRYIDVYLPNLQSLEIRDPFEASVETIHILCRLSKLRKIKLSLFNADFVAKIKFNLKKKCKRMQTIDIKAYKRYPKHHNYYYYSDSD